jgi:hypothetical protein
MAALNDLQDEVGDILNAYITAPITKKVWTVLGHEFDSDASKCAAIVCTLYGLNSAGAAFCAHLAYHSCTRWGTRLAKQTLAYGLRLRPGLMIILDTMSTY